MRMHRFVRCGALIALAVSPLVASAQFSQFQQPTQDELKMTADPMAPGAAAVFLNVEDNSDDNLGSRNYYARIKVLTEKGKELATVSIFHLDDYKIRAIKGRTIHPDGTIVPMEVKPEELLTAQQGDMKFGKKVFTLPSVEVGSILEYRYDLEYPQDSVRSPEWEVQRNFFIHKGHYSFTPFKGFLSGSMNQTSREIVNSHGEALNTLLWWGKLPDGAKVARDSIGRYSLDVTDVPPRPDEEYMPPIDSVLYKVAFYYKGSLSAQQFWQEEAKRWSKDVDHFAGASGSIRDAVAKLVAPGDTDLVKAKKLYDAVQALENTDYTRKKTESEMKQLKIKAAKRAEDTLAQKSGNSEEIAMLYLALLHAAGVNAYALKVVDRSRALFDEAYLYSDQFDDTLVILSAGGQDVIVDPGEKMCTFQQVSWRHSMAGGMRQMPNGSAYVQTPDQDYTKNTTARTGDITIDEHAAISGTFNFVFTGQPALRWRQVALRNDVAELKNQFDHDLESQVPDGIEAHVDHFLGLDDPDSNLVAIVNVSGSEGAATAKRLLLPGFFFEAREHEPFVNEEKRQAPVDMHYPERITDQVTYHLPAGMSVEGAPADASVSWAGHAIYVAKSKTTPGSVIVARQVAHAFTMTKPEEYQDLRGFYQKVATGDLQQLVLRAATEQKAE